MGADQRREGGDELTALADAMNERAGQPTSDGLLLCESERILGEGSDW